MLIGVRPFLREGEERGRKTSPFEQAGNTSRQPASETHYTEQREKFWNVSSRNGGRHSSRSSSIYGPELDHPRPYIIILLLLLEWINLAFSFKSWEQSERKRETTHSVKWKRIRMKKGKQRKTSQPASKQTDQQKKKRIKAKQTVKCLRSSSGSGSRQKNKKFDVATTHTQIN